MGRKGGRGDEKGGGERGWEGNRERGREVGRKCRHLEVEVFSWNILKEQSGKLHNSFSSLPAPGPGRSLPTQYQCRVKAPYIRCPVLDTSSVHCCSHCCRPSHGRKESSPLPLLGCISCLQVALRPVLWSSAEMCFVSYVNKHASVRKLMSCPPREQLRRGER